MMEKFQEIINQVMLGPFIDGQINMAFLFFCVIIGVVVRGARKNEKRNG